MEVPIKVSDVKTKGILWSRNIYICLGIALFGVLGAFCRQMMTLLSKWLVRDEKSDSFLGAVDHGSFLANSLACFLYSYLSVIFKTKSDPNSEFHQVILKFFIIGYCGCLSTFSAWIVNATELLVIDGDTMTAIARLLLEVPVLLSIFAFGSHIAWAVQQGPGLTLIPLVMIGFLPILGIAVASAFALWQPIDGDALVFLFAPCGALLRYALSMFNDPKSVMFMGTFAANSIGTFIAAVPLLVPSLWASRASVYFCGSLTTISSFINEIASSDIRKQYIYASLSIAINVAIASIVLELGLLIKENV